MNAPRLRFREFSDKWESKILGEISTFLDGRRKPIKESDRAKMKGQYPYYGASGIIDYVNDFIFDEEIILLGEDGENILSRNLPLAFKVTGRCWINNHAHVIKPSKSTNIDFITQYLDNISYVKYNTGTAQPKLNQEVCKSIPLNIPTLPEQTKIANFLTAVDEKIAQLTQKGDLLARYKNGVMQQIFSLQLRFKPALSEVDGDDDGREFPEWEEKELGKVTVIIMGQSPDSLSYNDTAEGKPLIQGNADISNRKTSPRIWTSVPTKECKTNDIILTVRAPVGAVAKSYHNACIGRGVCAIRSNYKSNVDFIYQLLLWFEPTKWVSLEQGSTFTAVNSNDIKTLIIPVPCIEEQTKIANFLTALDDKISHNQTQLNALKQYKQGLLQQMFV